MLDLNLAGLQSESTDEEKVVAWREANEAADNDNGPKQPASAWSVSPWSVPAGQSSLPKRYVKTKNAERLVRGHAEEILGKGHRVGIGMSRDGPDFARPKDRRAQERRRARQVQGLGRRRGLPGRLDPGRQRLRTAPTGSITRRAISAHQRRQLSRRLQDRRALRERRAGVRRLRR